jgi:hypothetical protein
MRWLCLVFDREHFCFLHGPLCSWRWGEVPTVVSLGPRRVSMKFLTDYEPNANAPAINVLCSAKGPERRALKSFIPTPFALKVTQCSHSRSAANPTCSYAKTKYVIEDRRHAHYPRLTLGAQNAYHCYTGALNARHRLKILLRFARSHGTARLLPPVLFLLPRAPMYLPQLFSHLIRKDRSVPTTKRSNGERKSGRDISEEKLPPTTPETVQTASNALDFALRTLSATSRRIPLGGALSGIIEPLLEITGRIEVSWSKSFRKHILICISSKPLPMHEVSSN